MASGLLLDVAIAARFGAGHATDAFFVASRLPIGVGTVLLGGTSLSLVPMISTWLATRGPQRTSSLLTALLTVLTLGSAAICLPIALAAPLIVRALAPGMAASSTHLAGTLLPVLLLVVPLTAIAETLRSALNARHLFAAPALMNAILNIVAAAIVLVFARHGIVVAAWAYVAGAAGRVLFALPLAWHAGYRWIPRSPVGCFREPETRVAIRLSVRPAASAGLAPSMRIVEQGFASFLPTGSITLLAYGYRLIFALGGTVFFRSIIGIIVPRLTEATVGDDIPAVRRLTANAFRAMTAVSVGLVTLFGTMGVPICLVIFHRGNFTRHSAILLGSLVAILALSLVGEAWQRVLLVPFFAGLDTRTPFRNALYGAGAEFVLLPLLVLPQANGYGALYGIAVAFVLSEYVGPVHAWWHLRRRIGGVQLALGRTAPPVVAAGVAAAVVALALQRTVDLGAHNGRLAAAALLLGALAAVTGAYAGVLFAVAGPFRRPGTLVGGA